MSEYHKINTLWKRQAERPCDMIVGEFATPEFELLADINWRWEEKVDGTNIRILFSPDDPSGVLYRGKTDRAQTPDFLREYLGHQLPYQKLASVFDTSVILYGEGFGAKIQKGGGNYISDGCGFCLFDVLINGVWLERENVKDIAVKLEFPYAPVVGIGTLDEANQLCSEGFESQWGKFEAEGIVMRPEIELQDRRGRRIITKLKTKDFRAIERHNETN